jgi:hypothetical protein
MKKYLVVDVNDANDSFIVDDLKEMIIEMFEPEMLEDGLSFDEVKERFFNNYKVFVSESNIVELDGI